MDGLDVLLFKLQRASPDARCGTSSDIPSQEHAFGKPWFQVTIGIWRKRCLNLAQGIIWFIFVSPSING